MRSKKSAAKLTAAMGAAKVSANELQDRIGPAIQDAREVLTPMVEDARERLTPMVDDARTRLTPMVEDARGRLVPVVDDARTRLTPVVEDARGRMAELAETVATRLDESLPDNATPAMVKNASARKSGGNKFKKLLLVAGVGTAVAFVASKLKDDSQPQWQSTTPVRPTPAPAGTDPAAESAVAAPAAAVSGLVAAEDQAPDPDANDTAGGGTPDEAAADATETPHVPTTPDNPTETVEVDKG